MRAILTDVIFIAIVAAVVLAALHAGPDHPEEDP